MDDDGETPSDDAAGGHGAQVVCAGHVNWDVTLQVTRLPEPDGESHIHDQTQAGGGSASNTAAVLAGLDYEPLLLGSVGDDEYGRLALAELADAGVDCTHVRRVDGADTTVKYLLVDDAGEVMVLANDGANEQFGATDLPAETLEGAAHLHLTGQRPDTALALARRAREAGVPVSVDPGRRFDDREFDPVLELAETVFFNEPEAEAARERGLAEQATALTVCKRGDGGAVARGPDGTVTHPGFAVDPVDTAGAGDAFAAGFLAARLDGAGVERALAVGNACGALAARTAGARASLSWAQVEELLADG
jgi:ribokinase